MLEWGWEAWLLALLPWAAPAPRRMGLQVLEGSFPWEPCVLRDKK